MTAGGSKDCEIEPGRTLVENAVSPEVENAVSPLLQWGETDTETNLYR
jgi:hypothetical protein